ncbi:helix-turn-helix transcriptional regulator [Paludisphaera sp.]|uniref:helix-turn-helix domain-containing protein n=1 Tax=Paludisphaera sp. TaxID=2017432 RepID=UPI00301E4BD4
MESGQTGGEKGDRRRLADVLKRAIDGSGLSHYELGKRAGVASQGIMRFARGQRGLTLDVADRLCEALGLTLYSERKIRRLRARLRRAESGDEPPLPAGEMYSHQTIYRAPERPGSVSAGLAELRARHWLRSWCLGDTSRWNYLSHMWPEVDRSNRPLYKLYLSLMHEEGDRGDRLDYFVSCLMELNPLRDQILKLPQLVQAVEIVLDQVDSTWACGPLGAKLTPEDVERIIKSSTLASDGQGPQDGD